MRLLIVRFVVSLKVLAQVLVNTCLLALGGNAQDRGPSRNVLGHRENAHELPLEEVVSGENPGTGIELERVTEGSPDVEDSIKNGIFP